MQFVYDIEIQSLNSKDRINKENNINVHRYFNLLY